jgi:hypothetical protein
VLGLAKSLVAYRARTLNSANLFAVSVTMSIRRCSLLCNSGMFTLSVTRYALPTLLNQFLPPDYGNARQLSRVRYLTCASGRAHDRAQEDVDADGSIGQAAL